MQLRRYALIMLACVMLCSCASTRNAQELAAGKMAFQAGAYKQAFHTLLPLAVKGKPDAQYAIGYMYYYGYGAPEDSESGVFWMDKAAEQAYVPAITALELIRQHNAEANRLSHAIESDKTYRQDEVLQAVPATPVNRYQKTTLLENNNLSAQIKVSELKKLPAALTTEQIKAARNYTLQLYGSYQLMAVKDLQLQLQLKNTGHIYHTINNSKDWYILTFGNFVTAHKAAATKRNLPEELKELRPWVRKVNKLEML